KLYENNYVKSYLYRIIYVENQLKGEGEFPMDKKTIKDIDVKGKRVFCRVDFNVPMQNGEITDHTRIIASLPTITYLIEQGAKIILATHLGRPKGEVVEELR